MSTVKDQVLDKLRFASLDTPVGMMPSGKGMYIWLLNRIGTPQSVATELNDAGYRWVAIKLQNGLIISDGSKREADFLKIPQPYIAAIRAVGIKVFGWGYVYLNGDNQVLGEITATLDAIRYYQVDGWIINAEQEAKCSGDRTRSNKLSSRYVSNLRAMLGGYPLGFTTYRYLALHPEFPWDPFFDGCDYAMPQVYWLDAHNPRGQLNTCIQQYHAHTRDFPILPIGSAYPYGSWSPTLDDLDQFYQAVQMFELPAWSWWEYRYAQLNPAWWSVLKSHGGDGSAVVTAPGLTAWARQMDQWARAQGYVGVGVDT